MFSRRRFLSLPMVVGAALIGVVSGKAIFGPPLDEYWKKKLQDDETTGRVTQGLASKRLIDCLYVIWFDQKADDRIASFFPLFVLFLFTGKGFDGFMFS